MRLRRLGGILSFVLTFLVAFEVVSLVAIRTGALPTPVPKFIPPGLAGSGGP